MEAAEDDNCEALCPAWGDCRLQDLAYQYQVEGGKYPRTECRYPMETVNPLIVRDFSAPVYPLILAQKSRYPITLISG